MLRAILVDDEPESLQVISSLIEMFCPNVTILGTYTDPFQALETLREEKPDVVLLDIEMPGMTGLELLHRLPSIEFEVIFITAYNQYAVNAIKLSALDYLLKPVDPAELESALQKAEERLKGKKTMQQFDVLVGLLSRAEPRRPSQNHKIALPTFDGIIYLEMAAIVRIEAEKGYCRFILQTGNPLVISKHIGVYDESLDPYDFMRVHRSNIVNLHCVTEFVRYEGGYLRMKDGSKVPVSDAKKEKLLERLAQL